MKHGVDLLDKIVASLNNLTKSGPHETVYNYCYKIPLVKHWCVLLEAYLDSKGLGA